MSFADQPPPNFYPRQPATGDPGSLDLPYYGIGFGAAIKRAFSKYVRFDGRASRGEYWWFYLFVTLVSLVMIVLMGVLGGLTSADGGETIGAAGIPFMVLWMLFSLAVLLPSLGVLARRLHDANLSALFILLGLIPSVGTIILIVLAVLPSKPEGARFDRPQAGQPPRGF